MYGNPETTTGGNALKFYASVRLEVRKTETIEGGKDEDAVGNRVRVKVVKNKVAPPFRKVELEIMFGKGVSAMGSILDAAIKYELIDKKGAWYSYGEERVGQGRDNVVVFLQERPELVIEFEEKLRKIMFPGREFSPTGKKTATKAAKTEEDAIAADEAAAFPEADAFTAKAAEPPEEAAGPAVIPAVPSPAPVVPPAATASAARPAAVPASAVPASAVPASAAPRTPVAAPASARTAPPVAAPRNEEKKSGPASASPAGEAAEPRHPGRPRKNPNPASGLF
jgi:recombination protein RecA